MILHKAGNRFAWLQKLRTYMPKRFNPDVREATDIIFSVMVIFMITCIGSMLLICFFFEMDRRLSSPPVQPRSDAAATPTR
ncbi:MAG: hypothetical protein KME45_15005 [Stenomitos rutilans HA7619-LM2]|jgi:hypothetical protein|nr:hypothetical protein [Stenomitos rutilans HA7619-LM2]